MTSGSDSLICVDASVIAKWLLAESDTDRALGLYADATRRGDRLLAPSYFAAEASSAIYKQLQQGNLQLDEALPLVERVELLPIVTLSPPGLPLRAFEIATQFNLKWIYDAFYVALAEIVGCDLWTADEKLHESVSGAFPNVRLLTHYQPASP